MGYNPVLDSTRPLIENPKYVFVNEDKIYEAAQDFAKTDLELPAWGEEWYPTALDNQTVDFMMVMNSQNFQFTDFDNLQKYTVQGSKYPLAGAAGMQLSLKRAVEAGSPILEGEYLATMPMADLERIFTDDSGMVIPMTKERLEIFHEVGQVLTQFYDGKFHNFVEDCGNTLFDYGNGLIERLKSEFPIAYGSDNAIVNGKKVHFDKRAQLAPAMLTGKFQGTGRFEFSDMDDLTVFLDYGCPNTCRGKEIFEYESSLAERIDNQVPILKDSVEEHEIRASTGYASNRLINGINVILTGEGRQRINGAHMDFALWKQRKSSKYPNHLTETTAY